MIKKLLFVTLIIICLSHSKSTFAQSNSCFVGYSFKTSSVPSENSITNDIILSWNNGNVSNKQHLNIEIEVQPLNACWNALEGTTRSEKRLYNINSTNNDIGEIALKFSDLNSKCFKWRVKLTNTSINCVELTEWEFSKMVN